MLPDNARYTIYALLDPATSQPIYIGATAGTLAHRLACHLTQARGNNSRPVHAWMSSLSVVPAIIELESGISAEKAAAREEYWTRSTIEAGHRLLSPLSRAGHSLKPETRKTLSNSAKRRWANAKSKGV